MEVVHAHGHGGLGLNGPERAPGSVFAECLIFTENIFVVGTESLFDVVVV